MTLMPSRALIVEDERSWQQILSEILTDAGLAVDVADSLEGAVAILRATPHRLAVVDLSLSGDSSRNEDGLSVLDAVRSLDPACATILLTGFATVELAVSALHQHGAFTCLRKEAFSRSDFRDWVARALASAPPVSREEGGEQAATTSELAGEAPGHTEPELTPGRALIVEDDAGWRSILGELLTDAGYDVHLCAGFGEALGHLRRDRYDLAVVDLSLASSTLADASLWQRGPSDEDLDGYRLLASTRAVHVPTIVVSGVATTGDIERAYAEHGIFAFVEKQAFDRRAFLRTVYEARAAATIPDGLEALTGREQQVLALLVQGLTNKEIAQSLYITPNTVKRHLKSIFAKLDVHTRSAAASKAVSAGISVDWTEADADTD